MHSPDPLVLAERKQQLEEDVFPYVVGLPNFLGNVDYNTDFYHFVRPGLSSWEFHDTKTRQVFHTFLVGEVADATHGTLLGAIGNKKRSEGTIYPLQDGTKVKNIITLRQPLGSATYECNAFSNQFIALEQIVADVNRSDDDREKPTNGTAATWVDSTVAYSETHRPTDLLAITLPRKYNTPNAEPAVKQSPPLSKRLPVTAAEDHIASPTKQIIQGSKVGDNNEATVVIGGDYDPHLLPDYSSNELVFIRDRLIQHDIRDLDGNLIPAWKIADGLRPGTVIGVKATLHVYNIPNRGPGFRRYYQIDAEKIRVMSEAIQIPDIQPMEPPPYSSASSTIPDLDSYQPRKRPAPASNPTTEKTKKKTKHGPSTSMDTT